MTMQNAGNGGGGQNGNGAGGQGANGTQVLTDQAAADALRSQQQNGQQTQQNQQNNGQNQQPNQQQQVDPKDAQIAELNKVIQDLQGDNRTMLEKLEILAVESLPPDQKARAKELIEAAKQEATKEIQETSVTIRELALDRREIAGEYATYGLTQDALKDAKSRGEMEVIALRTKADFLEKGGKPNPASIPSDKGGSQGGGGGNGANGGQSNGIQVPNRGDRTANLIGERFRQARNE